MADEEMGADMRWWQGAVVLGAVTLAAAGCGTSSKTVAVPPTSSTTTATTAPPPTKCNLPETGDLISWSVGPDEPANATEIGSVDLEHCQPTVKTWPASTDTSAGTCNILAPVSANPGYNADAEPAKRPKGAIAETGPSC